MIVREKKIKLGFVKKKCDYFYIFSSAKKEINNHGSAMSALPA